MAQDIDSKHLRMLEITLRGDESADTVLVTDVDYARDGKDGAQIDVPFSAQAEGATHYVLLTGGIPEGVTLLKFVFTQQA